MAEALELLSALLPSALCPQNSSSLPSLQDCRLPSLLPASLQLCAPLEAPLVPQQFPVPSQGSGSLLVCLNGFCKGNPGSFPKTLHLSPAAVPAPAPKSFSLLSALKDNPLPLPQPGERQETGSSPVMGLGMPQGRQRFQYSLL